MDIVFALAALAASLIGAAELIRQRRRADRYAAAMRRHPSRQAVTAKGRPALRLIAGGAA